jgi:hypothetical protein
LATGASARVASTDVITVAAAAAAFVISIVQHITSARFKHVSEHSQGIAPQACSGTRAYRSVQTHRVWLRKAFQPPLCTLIFIVTHDAVQCQGALSLLTLFQSIERYIAANSVWHQAMSQERVKEFTSASRVAVRWTAKREHSGSESALRTHVETLTRSTPLCFFRVTLQLSSLSTTHVGGINHSFQEGNKLLHVGTASAQVRRKISGWPGR